MTNNRKPVFGRVVTAIVTPFSKRGQLDYEAARRLLKHVQPQCDAIVVAGTTGEGPTLTLQEKMGLIQFYREHARKSLKILANVGTNNTAESVKIARRARAAGADGLMAVGPYYNKPNPPGQLAHFSRIAAATDLPVLLYNIPGRTSLRVDHDVIVELAATTRVCAVKDATGDLEGIARLRSQTSGDFFIYSGDDSLTLPILAVGGCGVVSVASHLIGRELGEMIRAFEHGEVDQARELHLHFLELMCELFMTTNPIPLKQALAEIGVIEPYCRLPLVTMSGTLKLRLASVLREYGFLENGRQLSGRQAH
jgi:4-hydroxy-tetrahydrodipicolinate synthase